MKKILLPLIIVCLTTLTSCSEDDNNNTIENNLLTGIWEIIETTESIIETETLTFSDNSLTITSVTEENGQITDNSSIDASYEIVLNLLVITIGTEVESYNYSIEGNTLLITSLTDPQTRTYTKKE